MLSHPTATVRHTAHKLWEGAGALEDHSGISIRMDGGTEEEQAESGKVKVPKRSKSAQMGAGAGSGAEVIGVQERLLLIHGSALEAPMHVAC